MRFGSEQALSSSPPSPLWGWVANAASRAFSPQPLSRELSHLKNIPAYCQLNLDNFEISLPFCFLPTSTKKKKKSGGGGGSDGSLIITLQTWVSGQISSAKRGAEALWLGLLGAVSSGPPEQQAEWRLGGKATHAICTSHQEKWSVIAH